MFQKGGPLPGQARRSGGFPRQRGTALTRREGDVPGDTVSKKDGPLPGRPGGRVGFPGRGYVPGAVGRGRSGGFRFKKRRVPPRGRPGGRVGFPGRGYVPGAVGRGRSGGYRFKKRRVPPRGRPGDRVVFPGRGRGPGILGGRGRQRGGPLTNNLPAPGGHLPRPPFCALLSSGERERAQEGRSSVPGGHFKEKGPRARPGGRVGFPGSEVRPWHGGEGGGRKQGGCALFGNVLQ